MLFFLNDVKDKIFYNYEIFMKYLPLLSLIFYFFIWKMNEWMCVTSFFVKTMIIIM